MARGLNKVQLIGNLGKDPEMKYTQQGKPVTTFSMAVSRSWKGPDGQMNDETEWFRIVAWERLAEQCNEYLRKGSKVYIEGRFKTREYQTQEGQQRQTTEVVAYEMLLLDSRQGGSGPGGFEDERSSSRAVAPSAGGGGSRSSADADDADMGMDADDIPF